MKIVRKISTCIFLLGFLCGVCAIPIVILGLPELTNIYRSRVDTNLGDWWRFSVWAVCCSAFSSRS